MLPNNLPKGSEQFTPAVPNSLHKIADYPDEFAPQDYINSAILALYRTFHHNIALTGLTGSMPEQALQKVVTTMRKSKVVNRQFYWATLDELQSYDFNSNQLSPNETAYIYIIDFNTIIKSHIANTIISELNVFLRQHPNIQLMIAGNSELAVWIKSNSLANTMFTNIKIEPPSDQDLLYDISNSLHSLANSNNVNLSKNTIKYAIKLSHEYFYQEVNPGATINIIDQALADLRVFKFTNNEVTKELLNTAVEQILGITVDSINSPTATIANNLSRKVFGQDKAIKQIAQGLTAGRLGIRNPNRPLYSCLGFGSTGIGKTLLAQTISDTLYGKESHLFTLDMGEYADERLGPARLLGSPVGYEGHELGGLLTSTVMEYPQTVILLDEFEKAASTVKQIFLQILDQGYLLDNKNNRIDFTHTIIIATSNAGQDVHQVGFKQNAQPSKTELIAHLKDDFAPELLNRFDDIIEFKPLTKDDFKNIFMATLHNFTKRINQRDLSLDLSASATSRLCNTVINSVTNGRQAMLLTNQLLERQLQKQMNTKHELA